MKIRITTMNIEIARDEARYTVKVNLRRPARHECNPSMCNLCLEQAEAKALRQEPGDVVETTFLRDRLVEAR